MKSLQWICGIVAVLVFSTAVFAGERDTSRTILLTNGEWPPFLSQDLKHGGVVSRIVKEAFALEGVKVEYGYFAWQRAYDLALHGDLVLY